MNGLGDVIVFLIIVVVAIFIMAIQALARLAQKGQPQRPGPPRPQGPGPQGPPGQQADLNDQIGEFLRQAAQRRRQLQEPPPAERAVRAEVVEGRGPVRAEVLREQARAAARRQAQAAQAARRVPPHGPPRAGAPRPAERSDLRRDVPAPAVLGLKPEPAADAPRVALPSVFAADPSSPASGAAPGAARLYTILSEPAGLRQAILLAEILNRPEDRW